MDRSYSGEIKLILKEKCKIEIYLAIVKVFNFNFRFDWIFINH